MLCASSALAEGARATEPPAQPQPAQSQPAAEEEILIRATGSAAVEAPADRAVLALSVYASGDTVSMAREKADQQLQALRAALEEKGVTGQAVQAEPSAVDTIYQYQFSKLGEKEQVSGYGATIELTACLDDVNRVAEVIDAAVQGGAQSGYELTYESSQYQSAYDAALAEATRQAMERAGLLAESAGLKLGRLVSVTELKNGAGSAAAPLTAEAAVEVCYTAQP